MIKNKLGYVINVRGKNDREDQSWLFQVVYFYSNSSLVTTGPIELQ